MNGTASERPARTAAERTLDTLKYFFEAALDDARMVLRTLKTIQAIACRGSWKHLPPEPGEYRQAGPATSGETAPSKTPPPAGPAETFPRPSAATAPKNDASATPAAADTNTGAGATTKAAHAEPPKKTTPARQAGVEEHGKGIAAPKLTETQVREIRRAYRPGGKTRALARKYGVSPSNILLIAQRGSWKHLEPGPGEYIPPPADSGKPAATAAEPPPPPRRHATARTATPAAKAKPTAVLKPNGAGRNTPQAAPTDHAAARIHAEKQRLSADSIRSIRERAADDVPPRRIARDFGISEETVRALAG